MAEYLPKFMPGAHVTYGVTAAVVGGQLVTISGNGTVAPTASPADTVEGVTIRDAAVGQQTSVVYGGVQTLTASGALAAGQRVMPAAGGRVQAWAAVAPATAPLPEHVCGHVIEFIASGGSGRVRLHH